MLRYAFAVSLSLFIHNSVLADTSVTTSAVAPSGRVYSLLNNNDFVFSDDGRSGNYRLIDNGVQSFALASGRVYALKTNGVLMFSDNGQAPNYSTIDNGVKGFAVAAKGRVYALKTNGVLMFSDNGQAGHYSAIDNGVHSFALAPSGRVYALKTNGVLMFSDTGLAGQYSAIDNGVKEFAVAAKGRVYALKTNGVLMFSDTGLAGQYSAIDTGVSTFTQAPSGRIYALKSAGGEFIYVKNDPTPKSTTIDTGVVAFTLTSSGRVYALRSSGTLIASDIGYAPYFWSVADNVRRFQIESSGGVAVTPLAGPPSQPLQVASQSSGFKFSGSAEIIVNPALHLDGESGRVRVEVNWDVSGEDADTAQRNGLASFKAYLQRLAAWHYGTIDEKSVSGSLSYVNPPTPQPPAEQPNINIIYENAPDRTTQLAYVTNNSSKAVRVTVHWETYRNGGGKIGEGDSYYEVAPGGKAFIGGTIFNGRGYVNVTRYNIKTAQYK